MLAQQRHAYILERLRADGAVRVSELMAELDVSDMTVRRDLEVLGSQGHLLKVHGGATLLRESAVHEPFFATKRTLEHDAKMAIARAAAALVEPGMAVAVSAGSTTYEVSRRLADVPRLTVVTNSVPAAEVLYHGGRSDQTIILSGGVRTPSDALVGPFAVNALRNVNVDIVFLGVHGMHERAGFTTPNLLEAETDQALIETGGRLVVTADHTKWGVAGVSTIARLARADVVVSDAHLGSEARALLRNEVGELLAGRPGGGLRGARRRTLARGPGSLMPALDDARLTLPTGPHRRYDPLSDQWVLVSAGPHAAALAGSHEGRATVAARPAYDPACYLCPGNVRASGSAEPRLRDDLRLHQRLRRPAPRRRGRTRRGRAARRGIAARDLPGGLLLAPA